MTDEKKDNRDLGQRLFLIVLAVGLAAIVVIAALRTLGMRVDRTMSETGVGPDEKGGFANNYGGPLMAQAPAEAKTDAVPTAPEPLPKEDVERKLVRKMRIMIIAKDTDEAVSKIEDIVSEADGYVSGFNATKREEAMYYTLTLRVPSPRFAEVRAALRELGLRIEQESIETEDVTDKYVDLAARKKALERTVEDLEELREDSKGRARNLDEIVRIQQQITQVRSQIEQIVGRMRMWDRLATYSTITVHVQADASVKPVVDQQWRPVQTVRSSSRTFIRSVQAVTTAVIYLVIVVLPWTLAGLLIVWLVHRVVRGRGRLSQSQQT